MIDESNVEAGEYGLPVNRERKLTRLFHKAKVNLSAAKPFADFHRRFTRKSSMSWKEFYCLHLFGQDHQARQACKDMFVLLVFVLLNLN